MIALPRYGAPALVLILVLLGCAGRTDIRVAADAAPRPSLTAPPIFERVETVDLDNGLTFVLLPRHDIPLVAGRILVRVGNVDNPAGSTGLAHMFEHMAFKGTDVIGVTDAAAERAVLDSVMWRGDELTAALRSGAESGVVAALQGEISGLEARAATFVEPMAWPRLYDEYAFDFNAYTSEDITVYQAELPSNKLETWMLMESERLQHPVCREFYSELGVVKEERRQRTDDDPDGAMWELVTGTAFSVHPYRYPTIGYMEDLETLNPRMIQEFRARYYTPGNMVGALVGDFDPARARNLLHLYFDDLVAGPVPDGPGVVEPEPTAQRRAVHRQGAERRLVIAFPGFARDDPRLPAAELLAGVLAEGNTSRLNRRLDLDEGMVRSVGSGATLGFERYPGLFYVSASLMPGATNEAVEALVWEELARVVAEPVSDERLDEIRRVRRREFYFGLQSNADLAELLVKWQAFDGLVRRRWRGGDAQTR
ncbi:MAG: pitrilysin family protein [Candidatus Krumholzibacteriia bacterium]